MVRSQLKEGKRVKKIARRNSGGGERLAEELKKGEEGEGGAFVPNAYQREGICARELKLSSRGLQIALQIGRLWRNQKKIRDRGLCYRLSNILRRGVTEHLAGAGANSQAPGWKGKL